MECPQDAIDEVARLNCKGLDFELVEVGSQWFALTRVEAPSPPWDRDAYDILVVLPGAYADASLDAFYLGLPYSFHNNVHPRISGDQIQHGGRTWQLVSWHYPDNRPWQRNLDDIESHVAHCRGFFLNRGAENAIN